MSSELTRAVSIVGASRATPLRYCWALLFAAMSVIVVCMSGCGDGGAGPRPPTMEYAVEIVSDGTGAAGDGYYEAGATVTISAGAAPEGYKFKHWTSSSDSGVVFAAADSAKTTFVMPAKVVTVTAVFEERDAASPTTYAAIVSSPGTGASGSGDYAAGATVAISAGAAPDSMQFKNWTSSSGSGVIFANSDSAKTTFIMPAKVVTVMAVFESKSVTPPPPATYAVVVSSAGAGSTGGGGYKVGDTVAISAGAAPDSQQFKKWTAPSGSGVVFADADSAKTTFIMPARAVTVTATFESTAASKKYLVIVSSAGAGSTGGGDYAEGDTVAISAGTPPDGQKFKNWRSSGVTFAHVDSAKTTFIMPAKDVAAVAVFEPEGAVITPPTMYAVTVSSVGAGSTGSGDYEAGDSVKISAGTAPDGLQFKKWTSPSGSGVVFADTNSAATVFIMPVKAVTVTANFEQKIITYKVTIVGGGTGSTGGGDYSAGTTVNITAGTAPSGQRFKNWTTSSGVNFASATSAATTFTMPANAVTVTANFEPIPPTTYAVTVSSAGAGASGGGDYAAGDSVAISAGTAPSGQRFKNWTTASAGVTFANANSAATKFKMPANAVTVTAEFETVYAVTVSSVGTNNSGAGSYAAGATVTIAAGTAPTGKQFKNWTTASAGVTFTDANNDTTTFTMPANAVTVTANFVDGFIDARDGKSYRTAKIGTQTWMAENLNYNPGDGGTGSWCYGNSADSCNKYGRLYNWYIVMNNSESSDNIPSGVRGVCPVGWHVPSNREWDRLLTAAGVGGVTKLKAVNGWNNFMDMEGNSVSGNGTDDFGFSALPGGERSNGTFDLVGYDATWWTATEDDEFGSPITRYMGGDYLDERSRYKDDGFSLRCVQD